MKCAALRIQAWLQTALLVSASIFGPTLQAVEPPKGQGSIEAAPGGGKSVSGTTGQAGTTPKAEKAAPTSGESTYPSWVKDDSNLLAALRSPEAKKDNAVKLLKDGLKAAKKNRELDEYIKKQYDGHDRNWNYLKEGSFQDGLQAKLDALRGTKPVAAAPEAQKPKKSAKRRAGNSNPPECVGNDETCNSKTQAQVAPSNEYCPECHEKNKLSPERQAEDITGATDTYTSGGDKKYQGKRGGPIAQPPPPAPAPPPPTDYGVAAGGGLPSWVVPGVVGFAGGFLLSSILNQQNGHNYPTPYGMGYGMPPWWMGQNGGSVAPGILPYPYRSPFGIGGVGGCGFCGRPGFGGIGGLGGVGGIGGIGGIGGVGGIGGMGLYGYGGGSGLPYSYPAPGGVNAFTPGGFNPSFGGGPFGINSTGAFGPTPNIFTGTNPGFTSPLGGFPR